MPVLDPNLIIPGQHERRVWHEHRRHQLVILTGALLVALGLAWFGGSNLCRFRRDELADSAVAPARSVDAPASTGAAPRLSGELAAVKQAIDLMREGKTGEATRIKKSIDDPVARKVVEWLILRHPSGDAGFGRYAAFIAENPSWPSIGLLRRRAEGRLWQERSEAATVRRFTGAQPTSGKGRFALARAMR
jgi:soluble lytic murein transglycosylase